MWWREINEVENEGTSHNFSLFAIFLPKISKLVEIWWSSDKNNFAQFFWDTVYILALEWVAVNIECCQVCYKTMFIVLWCLLTWNSRYTTPFILYEPAAFIVCSLLTRWLETRSMSSHTNEFYDFSTRPWVTHCCCARLPTATLLRPLHRPMHDER